MKTFQKFLDFLIKTLKIIFLPNHCLTCENIINQNEVCCSSCMVLFEFINFNSCKKCDHPIDEESQSCSRCTQSNYFFTKNLSCVIYNDIVRKIINDIKNHHRTAGIYFFSNFIFQNFIQKVQNKQNFNIITCIPVSQKTLNERGFNHASLLAKDFFKKLIKHNKTNKINQKIQFIPDLLIKKDSRSQKTLTSSERQKNRLNIKINDKHKLLIKNKNIILIDDIATTCNTLNVVSRQLKLFECNEILCLTIARVILD